MSANRILNEALTYSQEKTEDEIEYTFFATLTDIPSQMQKATSSETHHQFERKIRDDNGREDVRFRSRSIDEGSHYEFTIKCKKKDSQGRLYNVESTLGSTEDVHEVIRNIADRRFHKIRYRFPFSVERNEHTIDLVWEVDVFVLADGSFDPMVKVDLEVPDASIPAPSFPFQASLVINAKNPTTEQETTIAQFWRRVMQSV